MKRRGQGLRRRGLPSHQLCVFHRTLQRGETNQIPGPALSLPLRLHLSTQMCDILQCCTVRRDPAADSPPTERSKRREGLHSPLTQVNGRFSMMFKSLFVYGVLGVMLLPVRPEQISVCVEDDDDLRVDCMIEPKANKINSYEFSWSSGTKEVLINTNVSGSKAELQFIDKSQVVELEPHGYRMTLSDFKDKLPHNTTYMCKISGDIKQITVEKDSLVPCSAVSVFLQRSWFLIGCLVFFLHHSDS